MYASVGTMLFACSLWLYWILWPVQVMAVKQFNVLTNPVHPNEDLIFEMYYVKSADYEGVQAETNYAFVCSKADTGTDILYPVLGVSSNPLSVGTHTAQEAIVVPTLPSSDCYLDMTKRYQINPARAVYVHARSNEFSVVPAPVLAQQNMQGQMSALVRANQVLVERIGILIEQNKNVLQITERLARKIH